MQARIAQLALVFLAVGASRPLGAQQAQGPALTVAEAMIAKSVVDRAPQDTGPRRA